MTDSKDVLELLKKIASGIATGFDKVEKALANQSSQLEQLRRENQQLMVYDDFSHPENNIKVRKNTNSWTNSLESLFPDEKSKYKVAVHIHRQTQVQENLSGKLSSKADIYSFLGRCRIFPSDVQVISVEDMLNIMGVERQHQQHILSTIPKISNIFEIFSAGNDNEEKLQDEWLKSYGGFKSSSSKNKHNAGKKNGTAKNGFDPLPGFVDARSPGVLPNFCYESKDREVLTQTAKVDIQALWGEVVLEFKRKCMDPHGHEGLKQVIERLRVLMTSHCYIKRSFGFSTNGTDDGTFVVFYHRELNADHVLPHYYDDNIYIYRIRTQSVVHIWQVLHHVCSEDKSYFVHDDAYKIARTLLELFGFNCMRYTKVSLIGKSTSRIYGVYRIETLPNLNICTVGKAPMLCIKINAKDEHSLREHDIIEAVGHTLSAIDQDMFYVYSLHKFMHPTPPDADADVDAPKTGTVHSPGTDNGTNTKKTSDVTTRSANSSDSTATTIIDGRQTKWTITSVPINRTFETLKADFIGKGEFFKYSGGSILDDAWWNQLVRIDPASASPGFATIVMQVGIPVGSFAVNSKLQDLIKDSLHYWLTCIHKVALHTDLREPNLMVFPLDPNMVIPADHNEYCVFELDEQEFQSMQKSASVQRQLIISFNQVSTESQKSDCATTAGKCDKIVEDGDGADSEEDDDHTTNGDAATKKRRFVAQPIDYDHAIALESGQDSVEVDVTSKGGRTDFIKTVYKKAISKVNWTLINEKIALERVLHNLVQVQGMCMKNSVSKKQKTNSNT